MVAQRLLANAYLSGEGVAQDTAEAVRWLRLAAEQRDAAAQYVLGILYDEGRGVPLDLREAVKWYELAAQQGMPDAQFNLALCYDTGEGVPKDPKRAAEWLTKAAKSGDAQAQTRLGLAYINGNGVERNRAEAASWLRKAAYPPTEDPKAQFFLGRHLQEGEGLDLDLEAAVRWFRKASAQGYAEAQFHLGRLLVSGEGGERNPTEGRQLIEKAAAQRHKAATQYLAQGGSTAPSPLSPESSPMKVAAMRTPHSLSNTLPASPATGTFAPPAPESSPSLSPGAGAREPLPAVPALPATTEAFNRPPEKASNLAPSSKPSSIPSAAKEPGLPPFTPEPAAKAPPAAASPADIFTLPPATKSAEPPGHQAEPPRMLPLAPEPSARMESPAPSPRPPAGENNSGLLAIAAISTGISALILILGIYIAVVFKARLHGLESELKKAQFELSKANVNLSSMMHQVEQLSLMAPQTPVKTSLPDWNAQAPKGHTASFKMNRPK